MIELIFLIGNACLTTLCLLLLIQKLQPLRKAHTAREIADEGIVLAERSNLKGIPKLHVAVDYCEQEGKRQKIKKSRNEWAKLCEIRLSHGKKLAKTN